MLAARPCRGECRLMSVVVERRGFSLPLGVDPKVEVFAIGDIHGRSDLLAALIDEAAREPKLRDKRAIVFLGDLVDRGPDSLGAIDLAMTAKTRSTRSTPGSATAATGRWPSFSRSRRSPTISMTC
jgi:hypothetical protein